MVPAGWTVEHSAIAPQLGELSTKLEERLSSSFIEQAMTEAREEHEQYFAAIEKHPRMLVGQKVPRIDGQEGFETLRDAADAREWQDAVKGLLAGEVREKAARAMDENSAVLDTVHASVQLFQNNADLVPFTKDFDRELAERFTQIAGPYAVRDEAGKLNGYSIPVQPIIDQLRTALKNERATRPAAPAAPTTPVAGAAAQQATPAEPPQAGIQSKAGSSTESEDFSTLFGTLGLPNFTI